MTPLTTFPRILEFRNTGTPVIRYELEGDGHRGVYSLVTPSPNYLPRWSLTLNDVNRFLGAPGLHHIYAAMDPDLEVEDGL